MLYHSHTVLSSQDGRAVQGAAFRSQSSSLGVGSNPTSDKILFQFFSVRSCSCFSLLSRIKNIVLVYACQVQNESVKGHQRVKIHSKLTLGFMSCLMRPTLLVNTECLEPRCCRLRRKSIELLNKSNNKEMVAEFVNHVEFFSIVQYK